MWITFALALLGLTVGLRIASRLGALFLMFAAVTVVHVVFTTGPNLLGQSPYGRRLAEGIKALVHSGDASLLNLLGAALLGLVAAYLLHSLSADHPVRLEAESKRRKRAHKLRHDPC
jgi:hypothetical protein